MTQGFRPPIQQRSRETLQRLLDATILVMCEEGLEGATIPRIAGVARVAPASVYRRFANKQALVEAAFLRAVQRGGEASEGLLTAVPFGEKDIWEGAEAIVGLVYEQYRRLPNFMKAFRRFLENSEGVQFRQEALALLGKNLDNLVKALLMCRGVPMESERRVRFGLLNVVTSIEAITLDPESLWHTVQPMSDSQMKQELTRSLVTYITSKERSS